MTLADMQEAVSFASSPTNDFGPEDFIEEDTIFRKCSSLVRKSRIIERYSVPVIELAHFTVKEYLASIDDESDVSFFKFNRQKADEELSTFSLKMFVSKATKTKLDPLVDLKLNVNHMIERFIGDHFYLYSTARSCGLYDFRSYSDSHGKILVTTAKQRRLGNFQVFVSFFMCDFAHRIGHWASFETQNRRQQCPAESLA